MAARRAFVVGRRTPRSTAVVVVRRGPAPIRGPFTLRAVVVPGSRSPLRRG